MKKLFKRISDLLILLATIVLLLPVFAVIIIAIKISSKGPAVFKQERAGKDGEPFVFYKFRPIDA